MIKKPIQKKTMILAEFWNLFVDGSCTAKKFDKYINKVYGEAFKEGRKDAYAECMRNKTDFSQAKEVSDTNSLVSIHSQKDANKPTKTSNEWEEEIDSLSQSFGDIKIGQWEAEALKRYISDLLTTQRAEIKREIEKMGPDIAIPELTETYIMKRKVLELLSKGEKDGK
jgi:hypothetical protein